MGKCYDDFTQQALMKIEVARILLKEGFLEIADSALQEAVDYLSEDDTNG